jgi:hypothetical protein
MPTRLVREGIISSDRVDKLDWQAEVFYRRLLNKVDDHGLYDARPSVLRSSLYPLRVDRVREADCTPYPLLYDGAFTLATRLPGANNRGFTAWPVVVVGDVA